MPSKPRVDISLHPQGVTLRVERGASLREALFLSGVEFPCGGRGRCRGCRIKALQGGLPVTPIQQEKLSADELAQGWRLACQCNADVDLTLEVAQWDMDILSDDQPFSYVARPGFGVAVDLGTTTIAAQAVDLRLGRVVGVTSCLNPQAEFGADLISRVYFAIQENGASILTARIRECVYHAIQTLVNSAKINAAEINEVVLSGNTVMHHFFCGLDTTPLSQAPFLSPHDGQIILTAEDVQWDDLPNATVVCLPSLGSFVGGDLLAGILATGIHQNDAPSALIDLGTNGEIVIANNERAVCTSTAVGPAFEGGRIQYGMRASTGAVNQVRLNGGALECSVIGNQTAKGICGSGLVEAVAACLDLGWIDPSGRITLDEKQIHLVDGVLITQQDIRQLQLAKAAVAAGLQILVDEWGTSYDELNTIYLAGAFGNYVSLDAIERIGLTPLPAKRLTPTGNSSLRGAKYALGLQDKNWRQPVLQTTTHFTLSEHPSFEELYINSMAFQP